MKSIIKEIKSNLLKFSRGIVRYSRGMEEVRLCLSSFYDIKI